MAFHTGATNSPRQQEHANHLRSKETHPDSDAELDVQLNNKKLLYKNMLQKLLYMSKLQKLLYMNKLNHKNKLKKLYNVLKLK